MRAGLPPSYPITQLTITSNSNISNNAIKPSLSINIKSKSNFCNLDENKSNSYNCRLTEDDELVINITLSCNFLI